MSQLTKFTSSSGPGSGTVTSISAGTGITLTPNPITTTGTVALTVPVVIANGGTNAIAMANTFGVNYFDGTRIVTTAVGNAGEVLTSNGVGVAPTFQAPAASSISLTGDTGGPLVGAAFTIYANNAAQNSGSSVSISGAVSTLTLNVTDASNNTIIGRLAGNATLTGTDNTVVGRGAFFAATTGSSNAILGTFSGTALTSGDNNTLIGNACAGSLLTGDSNIIVGESAGDNYVGAESSNIIIGNLGVGAESNTIRIGTNGGGAGQQNRCFVAGIDGVNVGSTATVVTESSNQLGTAVITAGTGITITPGANTITIASSATAFAWSVITVDQTAVVNNGYICNKAGTLALALPAASAVGDIIEVTGINTALGWQITQGAGQQIFFGTSSTTLGATGTLTSSATRDSIRIVCVVANLTWNVLSCQGNITVV